MAASTIPIEYLYGDRHHKQWEEIIMKEKLSVWLGEGFTIELNNLCKERYVLSSQLGLTIKGYKTVINQY